MCERVMLLISVKSQMKSGSMQLQLLQNVRSCMETGGISCSIIKKKKEKRINHPFTIRLDKHPSLGELLKFFKNTTTRPKLRKITGQTYEVLEPPYSLLLHILPNKRTTQSTYSIL